MNGEPIDELEREIEETRQALDQTLSALRLELSPRHRLELAWQLTKRRTQRSVRAGADWAGGHPFPTVLASFAVGSALGVVLVKLLRRARR